MKTLDIQAPLTLYQAGDGAMNAALWYIPGEVHLVFFGPVLEKLSPTELLALLGHELAHYRLWSLEDGAFHAASRVLDHALDYPGAAASHHETARLFRLNTELYADRGGALAAGSIAPAIGALVKIMTGLGTVDTDAYLRQAMELDAAEAGTSGISHPETYIRAQALEKWWRGEARLDEWIDRRVAGPLSLSQLDLPRQKELTALTRGFLSRLLSDPALRPEAAVIQAKRYFPDWGDREPGIDPAILKSDRLDRSVRDYLIAVIFDLAMADPDLKGEMLAAGARAAHGFDGLDLYRAALKRDLGMSKPAIDKLLTRAGKGGG